MKIEILGLFILTAFAAGVPKINVKVHSNASPRIYHGKDAVRGQFKHQASVRWSIFGLRFHVCGGSLITPKTVLTAGHCNENPNGEYDVALGQLFRDDPDGQRHKIKEFIVHPDYPGGPVANDIALIILETAAKLGETVDIIPLKTGNCDVTGKDLYISGYGQTTPFIFSNFIHNHLKYDVVLGISNKECCNALNKLIHSCGSLDDTMVCTISHNDTYQGVCVRDSGGPLALDGVVYGLTSWGVPPCGTSGAPSVFTSVCAHADFINNNKVD